MRLKLDYYLLKGVFHKIWQNAEAVVANSKGLAKLASQFEPKLDIGVICNGIHTDIFKPPVARNLERPIKLLTVSRLITRKRIHLLIEAVALLNLNGIDAEFNIVGEGNLLSELKAQAVELKVADRVHFLGIVPYEKMPTIYQQNHLFLMASQHEGMSNAMLEAMACGLPIISTACEGTEELLNKNGRIVSIAAAKSFAEIITEIIKNPAQYTQVSEASRKIAENFSWNKSAQQYVDLYHKIAANN
jgi:glycosyltransferase involved in cell wall biosynthesis